MKGLECPANKCELYFINSVETLTVDEQKNVMSKTVFSANQTSKCMRERLKWKKLEARPAWRQWE